MLKKWFGIMKKKQKVEESDKEGEILFKSEEIMLDKEELLVNEVEEFSNELEKYEKFSEEFNDNILVADIVDNVNLDYNIIDISNDKEGKQYYEKNECLTKDEIDYIKEIKIKRGKSIKAINLYTKEEEIFNTHIECSKKLKIPLGYIRENLIYGYMDYFGSAIEYLSNVLSIEEYCKTEWSYLENNKSPSEIFNILNDKIFSTRLSDKKRNEILTDDKIETLKMNYRFECIDEEYNEYFIKYKSIIKRGGKKKVELVNKKGEVIEIFKSLEECSLYLHKEKNEIIYMLKYGETKIGRNYIRYSLRNV